MKRDPFSEKKKFLTVGNNRIAYYEEGSGSSVLLLHGCPFSSFIWRNVIPLLSPHYRCLAPDLLGLGDTETPANADWSLRAQAAMIVDFLDALGRKYDKVHDAIVKRLYSTGDEEWELGMHPPVKWDPRFAEFMRFEDFFRYPVTHFKHHKKQFVEE